MTQKTRSHLAWNDFEVVLVIATAGSLSGASRTLGVSHATIFRRLGDIEQRLGVTLFERSRISYYLKAYALRANSAASNSALLSAVATERWCLSSANSWYSDVIS